MNLNLSSINHVSENNRGNNSNNRGRNNRGRNNSSRAFARPADASDAVVEEQRVLGNNGIISRVEQAGNAAADGNNHVLAEFNNELGRQAFEGEENPALNETLVGEAVQLPTNGGTRRRRRLSRKTRRNRKTIRRARAARR